MSPKNYTKIFFLTHTHTVHTHEIKTPTHTHMLAYVLKVSVEPLFAFLKSTGAELMPD